MITYCMDCMLAGNAISSLPVAFNNCRLINTSAVLPNTNTLIVVNSSSAFALPELMKYGIVELMLNPKNKTANAMEFTNSACSPRPSGPKMRVMITDVINPINVLMTCAVKLNDMLFRIDNSISDFLIPYLMHQFDGLFCFR